MEKYIDADKMIVELFKGTMVTDDLFGMGKAEGIEFAARKIQSAPAADVVEVKRGKWMQYKECGEMVCVCPECKTLASPRWKCCPVCCMMVEKGEE